MNELENIIREEISGKGPITFARFMELALYHPEHGYYTSGRASIGRHGDFYTSPSTGPVFGRLIYETFALLRNRIGGPGCAFVEMGAGEGWLARDFLEAQETCKTSGGCDYIIIERSDKLRQRQAERLGPLAERVRWHASLDELPEGLTGVFFSNELVDALPFHRIRQEEDALREIFVTYNDGRFREASGAVSSPEIPRYFNRIGKRLPVGITTEARLETNRLIGSVSAKLGKGYVITVDYGCSSCEYYSIARPNGTLACYKGHKTSDNPYEAVGEQDITAHVDFTSFCMEGMDAGLTPLLFTDQTSFLMDAACRVEQRLKQDGAPQDEFEQLGKGLKTLVHPEWMGGSFKVLVQAKNAETSGIFADVKNDIDRLCECNNEDSFSMS